MSRNGIIISGGTIDDAFTMEMLRTIHPQYVIGVDKGLDFFYRNQVMPTHIVGDFDSASSDALAYYKKQSNIDIREFNPVKDATDTEIAVRLAVELEVERLWILGATGTRLDHVMGNIQTLKIALDNGMWACIVDKYNKISLEEKEVCLSREGKFGKYFSIFSFDGIVEGVSIKGAKYPLEHYRLTPYDSRCVSNEMQDDEVIITFPEGIIILMETRDKI